MSETMYRIYRASENDLFGAPAGWLSAKTSAWFPSMAGDEIGQFYLSKASELVSFWNRRFRSNGGVYRAVMEEVEK